MPIDASCGKVAAKRCGVAGLGLALILLGACAGREAPVASVPIPMRVAAAPNPPRTAQSLDAAVLSMTVALFDRARIDPPGPSGQYKLVVDPLIDRATGEQSVATRGVGQRIANVLAERYPDIQLQPFNTASLEQRPLILLGAITAVSAPGIVPPSLEPRPQTYRIWAVLGDLRTGKVVSHETAWVQASEVDATPTGFFSDSPTWTSEGITAAYLKTCAGNAGDPIDPAYLAALEAQALVADGIAAYENGRYAEALVAYNAAARRPGGDQMRVLNGMYLSNRALGRRDAAEQAFGKVVDGGLDRGRLAVKFLFQPATTALRPAPAGGGPRQSSMVSSDYPMWLRQIAIRTAPRDICLAIVGHASLTGPEAVNQRLSAGRAATVRAAIVAERGVLRPRTEASGVGTTEPLIGTGTDDATDALDRRVDFRPGACPIGAPQRL